MPAKTGLLILSLAFLQIFLVMEPAFSKELSKSVVLEFAPLRGAMGQVSLRAESYLKKTLTVAVAYEDISHPGDREDMSDRSTKLMSDLVWYPELETFYRGLFFGGGVIYEQAVIGRTRNREYVSGRKPYSNELLDKWVNHDDYLSISQSLGYRHNFGKYLTASFRYVIDELVYQRSTTKDEQIYSYSIDTEGERDSVKQTLSLLAGFTF